MEYRGIAAGKAGNERCRGHDRDFGAWQRYRGEVSDRGVGANLPGVEQAGQALVQDEGAIWQIGSLGRVMALGPVGHQAGVVQDAVDVGGGLARKAGPVPCGAERAVIFAAATGAGAVACRQRCGLIKKE